MRFIPFGATYTHTRDSTKLIAIEWEWAKKRKKKWFSIEWNSFWQCVFEGAEIRTHFNNLIYIYMFCCSTSKIREERKKKFFFFQFFSSVASLLVFILFDLFISLSPFVDFFIDYICIVCRGFFFSVFPVSIWHLIIACLVRSFVFFVFTKSISTDRIKIPA